MIEKITLALFITFSIYWSVQIRPQPRAVAMNIDHQVETFTIVRG
jgi:hypothetical protein